MTSLHPLVNWAYGATTAQLMWVDGELHALPSTNGSRIGCTLGSITFCTALQPSLAKTAAIHSSVKIIANCDDMYICGPSESAIKAAWATLKLDAKQRLGLTIIVGETVVPFDPQHSLHGPLNTFC